MIDANICRTIYHLQFDVLLLRFLSNPKPVVGSIDYHQLSSAKLVNMEITRFTRSHRLLLMSMVTFGIFVMSYVKLNSEYKEVLQALRSINVERVELQKNTTSQQIVRANLEAKVNELEQRLYDMDVVYKDAKSSLEDAHIAFQNLEDRNSDIEIQKQTALMEAREANSKYSICNTGLQEIKNDLGGIDDIRGSINAFKYELAECKVTFSYLSKTIFGQCTLAYCEVN